MRFFSLDECTMPFQYKRKEESYGTRAKFLIRKSERRTHQFPYPEKEDLDEILMEVIEMILPKPSPVGGTKRTSKQYMFNVDLSDFF